MSIAMSTTQHPPTTCTTTPNQDLSPSASSSSAQRQFPASAEYSSTPLQLSPRRRQPFHNKTVNSKVTTTPTTTTTSSSSNNHRMKYIHNRISPNQKPPPSRDRNSIGGGGGGGPPSPHSRRTRVRSPVHSSSNRSRQTPTTTTTTTPPPPPPRTMYLIRHGESLGQRASRQARKSDDRLIDCALTRKGMEQAKLIPQLLLSPPIQLVVTSPLTRAIQTTLLAFPTVDSSSSSSSHCCSDQEPTTVHSFLKTSNADFVSVENGSRSDNVPSPQCIDFNNDYNDNQLGNENEVDVGDDEEEEDTDPNQVPKKSQDYDEIGDHRSSLVGEAAAAAPKPATTTTTNHNHHPKNKNIPILMAYDLREIGSLVPENQPRKFKEIWKDLEVDRATLDRFDFNSLWSLPSLMSSSSSRRCSQDHASSSFASPASQRRGGAPMSSSSSPPGRSSRRTSSSYSSSPSPSFHDSSTIMATWPRGHDTPPKVVRKDRIRQVFAWLATNLSPDITTLAVVCHYHVIRTALSDPYHPHAGDPSDSVVRPENAQPLQCWLHHDGRVELVRALGV